MKYKTGVQEEENPDIEKIHRANAVKVAEPYLFHPIH